MTNVQKDDEARLDEALVEAVCAGNGSPLTILQSARRRLQPDVVRRLLVGGEARLLRVAEARLGVLTRRGDVVRDDVAGRWRPMFAGEEVAP